MLHARREKVQQKDGYDKKWDSMPQDWRLCHGEVA
jgi:hypothetical protein